MPPLPQQSEPEKDEISQAARITGLPEGVQGISLLFKKHIVQTSINPAGNLLCPGLSARRKDPLPCGVQNGRKIKIAVRFDEL